MKEEGVIMNDENKRPSIKGIKNGVKDRFTSFNSSLSNILRVFDFNLYVETQRETEEVIKTYTEEEALNVGISKAISSIEVTLGEFDEIIDKKVLKKYANNSTMDIEVFIIVKELISTEKEIILEENEEGI